MDLIAASPEPPSMHRSGRNDAGAGRKSPGLVNALTLFGIVGWILCEAIERFPPQPVLAGSMFVVALVGLLVNIFVLWF